MSNEPIHLTEPLKFLLVDDSRAIQAIIRRAIGQCGYEPLEIRTANDGAQALEVMESFAPDLVISDWHMPRVSGLEMLQALRQMGHHKVRVGFVTTEKTPRLLQEAIVNGALFILHKPFDDAELVSAVAASVKDIAASKSATEPAKPAPIPHKVGEPVPVEALQRQLQSDLGTIPFRLIERDLMTPAKLSANVMLGLYASTGFKGVYAIGAMDRNAVCMVGGGMLRKNPMEVRAAMEAEQPEEQLMVKANEFLRAMAVHLVPAGAEGQVSVTLAKASIVKNSFAKLADVLAQGSNRSDFRLSIPGYGEGRIAFFVMQS